MTKRPPFSPEVRERAVRMVQEHQDDHDSRHAAIRSIAPEIGCSGEILRDWIKEADDIEGEPRRVRVRRWPSPRPNLGGFMDRPNRDIGEPIGFSESPDGARLPLPRGARSA